MKLPAGGVTYQQLLTAASKAISGQCFMIDFLLKDVGVHYLKPAQKSHSNGCQSAGKYV